MLSVTALLTKYFLGMSYSADLMFEAWISGLISPITLILTSASSLASSSIRSITDVYLDITPLAIPYLGVEPEIEFETLPLSSEITSCLLRMAALLSFLKGFGSYRCPSSSYSMFNSCWIFYLNAKATSWSTYPYLARLLLASSLF